MLDDPPEMTITSIVSILLACESKLFMRKFAGHGVGKRRDTTVCRFIAERIVPRIMFPVLVADGEKEVEVERLVDILEEVLLSIPDQQAYLIIGTDTHRRAIRAMIGKRYARRLKKSFTLSRKDTSSFGFRPADPGPKHGDEALAAQRRLGSLYPRYKWRRVPDMFDTEFTGHDGDIAIGTVWYAGELEPGNRWQWRCDVTMPQVLNSLPYGGADITRQAARDLEDHYDALKRLNGMEGNQQ